MDFAETHAFPSVSVVVNTLDRAQSLDRTLKGLRQLRYPAFELVVVPGPCTDETLAVLDKHANHIRVGFCPDANLSKSRNIGLGMAAGEIVSFIDDDAVPEPDWLEHLVSGFSSEKVAAVGGFIREHRGIDFQYQMVIANRFGDARTVAPPVPRLAPFEFLSPTGTNVGFRRDYLMEIGGFDEEYAYFLEETDVVLRLHDRGHAIAMVPEAEVHHYFLSNRNRNDRGVPKSRYSIAKSKAYFCWKNARNSHTEQEIRAHLESFERRAAGKLLLLALTGNIRASVAQRLRAELTAGITDGTRAANSPSEFADKLHQKHMTRFVPAFSSHVRPKPGMRLCCLSPLGALDFARSRLAQTVEFLVGRGSEVTLLFPGAGTPSVAYANGVWHHEIPVSRNRDLWQHYGRAALQEIDRVRSRRQFDMLIVPASLRGAIATVSNCGLPIALVGEEDEITLELRLLGMLASDQRARFDAAPAVPSGEKIAESSPRNLRS